MKYNENKGESAIIRFAFIIYEGVTLLDFAGVYDPVTRLKSMGFVEDLEYTVCAFQETVKTFEGLEIKPDLVKNDLSGFDFIFIPGGNGIAQLLGNTAFITWLKTVSPDATLVSVCGGSMILGAAGFLKGKKATTHPELMQFLSRFTENTSHERIVEDGNIITAGGVTAAIDLGLYLCEKIAGTEVERKIRKQMDYLKN